jgi:hypothetical protein
VQNFNERIAGLKSLEGAEARVGFRHAQVETVNNSYQLFLAHTPKVQDKREDEFGGS